MSICGALLVVGVTALLTPRASALKFNSPCPDLFHYDDAADQANQWTGTLTLLSPFDLHGVWIRLIFNEKLSALEVADDFGQVVPSDDSKEFLIKNRNFLLKAGTPTDVKITAKYNSDTTPTLSGYRLNAKMVCAWNISSGQLFAGDVNNKQFNFSENIPAFEEFQGCGTAPLKEAENGQWPWQAAVQIHNNEGAKYICGATLISAKHLLTSAHCVTYRDSEFSAPVHHLSVSLGKSSQDLKVGRIYLHPGYRAAGLLSDLAVIQLDEAVVIGDYVRPICLKQHTNSKEAVVLGYGIRGEKVEAKVQFLDEEECLEQNADLRPLKSDGIDCVAYTEDNDPCVGDSGSSLLSNRSNSVWELKGVVSVSVPLQKKHTCNSSNRVLVVNVGNYLKWIQRTVSLN